MPPNPTYDVWVHAKFTTLEGAMQWLSGINADREALKDRPEWETVQLETNHKDV
jgi:hypothetical protein